MHRTQSDLARNKKMTSKTTLQHSLNLRFDRHDSSQVTAADYAKAESQLLRLRCIARGTALNLHSSRDAGQDERAQEDSLDAFRDAESRLQRLRSIARDDEKAKSANLQEALVESSCSREHPQTLMHSILDDDGVSHGLSTSSKREGSSIDTREVPTSTPSQAAPPPDIPVAFYAHRPLDQHDDHGQLRPSRYDYDSVSIVSGSCVSTSEYADSTEPEEDGFLRNQDRDVNFSSPYPSDPLEYDECLGPSREGAGSEGDSYEPQETHIQDYGEQTYSMNGFKDSEAGLSDEQDAHIHSDSQVQSPDRRHEKIFRAQHDMQDAVQHPRYLRHVEQHDDGEDVYDEDTDAGRSAGETCAHSTLSSVMDNHLGLGRSILDLPRYPSEPLVYDEEDKGTGSSGNGHRLQSVFNHEEEEARFAPSTADLSTIMHNLRPLRARKNEQQSNISWNLKSFQTQQQLRPHDRTWQSPKSPYAPASESPPPPPLAGLYSPCPSDQLAYYRTDPAENNASHEDYFTLSSINIAQDEDTQLYNNDSAEDHFTPSSVLLAQEEPSALTPSDVLLFMHNRQSTRVCTESQQEYCYEGGSYITIGDRIPADYHEEAPPPPRPPLVAGGEVFDRIHAWVKDQAIIAGFSASEETHIQAASSAGQAPNIEAIANWMHSIVDDWQADQLGHGEQDSHSSNDEMLTQGRDFQVPRKRKRPFPQDESSSGGGQEGRNVEELQHDSTAQIEVREGGKRFLVFELPDSDGRDVEVDQDREEQEGGGGKKRKLSERKPVL